MTANIWRSAGNKRTLSLRDIKQIFDLLNLGDSHVERKIEKETGLYLERFKLTALAAG